MSSGSQHQSDQFEQGYRSRHLVLTGLADQTNLAEADLYGERLHQLWRQTRHSRSRESMPRDWAAAPSTIWSGGTVLAARGRDHMSFDTDILVAKPSAVETQTTDGGTSPNPGQPVMAQSERAESIRMKTVIDHHFLITAALAVNDSHAQTPDYEAACGANTGVHAPPGNGSWVSANLEPPPADARMVETSNPRDGSMPVYTDAQIARSGRRRRRLERSPRPHDALLHRQHRRPLEQTERSAQHGEPRGTTTTSVPHSTASPRYRESRLRRRTSPAAPTPASPLQRTSDYLVGDDVFTVPGRSPKPPVDMRTAANLRATGIETIVVRPRG